MPPYAYRGTCPKFVSHSLAVTEGWRTLASRTLWEFSTMPGCCCEGQSFRSDHPCGLASFQGLLQLLLATLFPNAWIWLPAHHSPTREGLCPGGAAQGSQELWTAVPARVLRLCRAVGSQPASRRSCCCPGTSSVSGALAAPFCSKFMNIFLDELAQSPASYVLQKLNP